MAFEDLFGSKKVISPIAEIVDNSNFGGNTGGFDFGALFSDPNFIRGLGESGAAISSGEPIGKAVGNFASNLTRRRAIQKNAQGLRDEKKTFQEQLLDAIRGGTALSPKDQNDAFDNFSIDGDGNVSLTMKNTPQKLGFQRQQSLESIRRPFAGGNDLPDFSNQPSISETDFAGLDSEDISMLLNAEQQFGKLDQNQTRILLEEKARRDKAIIESRRRTDDLKQLGEDRLAKSFSEKRKSVAKIEAKKLEVEGKKAAATKLAERKLILAERKASLEANANKLTPEELKVEALKLRKLTKEVENLEAGVTKLATVSDQIAQKRLDIAERAEARGIAEDEIANQDFILDPDTPRAQAEAQARRENTKVDGEQVFFNSLDAPWFGANTDIMDVWQIPEDLVFKGQKVTPPMLVELAKQRGVTLQKLITALKGQ